MNRKQVMIRAHQIARTLEGDYQARLSVGMKQAWNEAKNVSMATPKAVQIDAQQKPITGIPVINEAEKLEGIPANLAQAEKHTSLILYTGQFQYAKVYDYHKWPPGRIEQKGWSKAGILYVREMLPEELKELKEGNHEISFEYHTREELVEAEMKLGVDVGLAENAWKKSA